MNAQAVAAALRQLADAIEAPAPASSPTTSTAKILTLNEAAAELKRHPATVRHWIHEGFLKGRKDRGRYVVERAVVEDYIASIPNVKRRRFPRVA